MKGAFIGVVAGLSAALLIACAAQHAASSSMPPPSSAGGAGDPHAQIEALSAQLDQKRDQLQTTAARPQPAVACGEACERMATAQEAKDAACHPAKTQSCSDVCTLSDSICETKDKICNLAGELPGDAWAEGKCADAKSSCDTAHTRCCTCT